jgi:membrane protease YdiL (CAAX protease family)
MNIRRLIFNTFGRQPNPWLTIFLIPIGYIGLAIILYLSLRLFTQNYRPPSWGINALICFTIFTIYTFFYGRAQTAYQRQGLMWVLMVSAPWLYATVNVWSQFVPIDLTTNAVLKGLLNLLCIGVSEELIFRGVLFRAFQGSSMALYVLVTSIIFGLLHYYDQGYIGVVITTVVGSSYALARVAGSPLILLIVCHAVVNFPSYLPHTRHPQHDLVMICALLVGIATTVAFLSRRKNWTATVVKPCQPVHYSGQSCVVSNRN